MFREKSELIVELALNFADAAAFILFVLQPPALVSRDPTYLGLLLIAYY